MKKINSHRYFLQKDISALSHQLTPLFPEIKSFTSLKALQRSDFYKQYENEIHRVENGLEWQNCYQHDLRSPYLRVVAWNIERGCRTQSVINLLKSHPVLSKADVLLLTEADIGMGRSGNLNVPREIAVALQMNYCFANSFIVLGKGDEGEQDHDLQNELALHGTAILSRYKITSCRTVPMLHMKDQLGTLEQSIGRRKALICNIIIAGRSIDFAAAHLDLKTSQRRRALQLKAVLDTLWDSSADAQLIGGDFNTHIYNLKSRMCLLMSFLYKVLFLGVRPTISHYMTPEKFFEKPLFDLLTRHGFDYRNYNDVSKGTLYYDINDATLNSKLRNYVPKPLLKYLQGLLSPWNGCLPLRLDWLAGKNLSALQQQTGGYGAPQVINGLKCPDGRPVSDHSPIVVDLQL